MASSPLTRVLAAHDRTSRGGGALRDSLGDGYLLRTLPLARKLRRAVRALGYRVTPHDRVGYLAWPLGALREILERRELVYLPNVAPWRREHARGATALTLADLRRLPVHANHLAHESAHCVAHAIVFGDAPLALPSTRAAERRTLVRIQLCESFANALEVFAQRAPDPGVGTLFRELGFLMIPDEATRRSLRVLGRELGDRGAFGVLVMAFLHANFLYTRVTKAERRRARAWWHRGALSAAAERADEQLYRFAFDLSPEFRLITSGIYLKQLGLRRPIDRALDFDFLAVLAHDAELEAALRSLCEFATNPDAT